MRDRVLNQALFRKLDPLFDKMFIHDSYSCRLRKGTHAGVTRLDFFLRQISQNNTKEIYTLKCDVKSFFDSISHKILLKILKGKIQDKQVLGVIDLILRSFEKSSGKGLPLGNVTSQLFANIYLNRFDQFIKHDLKEKYYIRYCDDFIILSEDKKHLTSIIPKINTFLTKKLVLRLHPRKVTVRKVSWGVDFLGYVVFPHHKILRTRTKKRILRKTMKLRGELNCGLISQKLFKTSLQSYLGMLVHCNGRKIKQKLNPR